MKFSKRRLTILAAQIVVFIILLGWIGFLPIPHVSPPKQSSALQTVSLFYPPSASAGIYVGNASAVSYMQVSVDVVADEPILANAPVSVNGFGCMTAPISGGLEQVVVQFPQATPTNPLAPSGSNIVLIPTSIPNSYCGGVMFGGEMFLTGNATSLEWPSAYTSTPTMTLQYQNGTERSSTSIDSVVIQSPDSAGFWTTVAGKAALAAIVIGLIQAAGRETKQKDENPPVYVEKFSERLNQPIETNWSIRVWGNERIELLRVFFAGTQLPIFINPKQKKMEVVLVKGGGENFRIPSSYSIADDAMVRVQDGSKTLLSKRWGEIPEVSP